MKKFFVTAVCLLIFLVPVTRAQDTVIKFPGGTTPATVKGRVNPLSSKDYHLSVSAGLRVAIHLTSTSPKKLVQFNVRRNRYTGKPLPGADAVTDWEGTLKDGGDYWIGVFALPAAGEENFTLVISSPSDQPTDGSTNSDAPSICERVPCRSATTVRLKLNSKEYFEMEFPKGPYVADGFINILAGEEVLVEFDDANGALANPHYVKIATKPEQTISFRLEQTDEGTILRVKNPFARNIIYDCLIQHYSEQRLRNTSIIPVKAGLISFEMWPYPVAQAVISNVRYVQK